MHASAGAIAASMLSGSRRVLAAATSGPATRPSPSEPRPLRIYSWAVTRAPGITPMSWQPMSRTGPALFLRTPFLNAFAGTLAEVVTHGPKTDRLRDWMRNYFRRFDPGPRRIVLDEEAAGIGYWHLVKDLPTGPQRAAIFRPVWDDPAALSSLPADVRAFSPDDLSSHVGRGRDAIIAWQKYATNIYDECLRRVVFEPAVEAFGAEIEVSNYEDVLPSFPIYDLNGWPLSGRQFGNWSSPSCYLWNRGSRPLNRQKPAIWNNFIDSLNYVRSCLNRSWRVAPWVSYPTFHEGDRNVDSGALTRLWGELIGHMKASGVTDFLFWNPRLPDNAPENDTLAAKVFAEPAAEIPAGLFQPIDLDADVVSTGGKVTRYADIFGK